MPKVKCRSLDLANIIGLSSSRSKEFPYHYAISFLSNRTTLDRQEVAHGDRTTDVIGPSGQQPKRADCPGRSGVAYYCLHRRSRSGDPQTRLPEAG